MDCTFKRKIRVFTVRYEMKTKFTAMQFRINSAMKRFYSLARQRQGYNLKKGVEDMTHNPPPSITQVLISRIRDPATLESNPKHPFKKRLPL